MKSLQALAANSDLTLAQVFQLTGHLIYWAKATIVYPLCESNVYVISPDAILTSQLLDPFSEHFPRVCLLQVYMHIFYIAIFVLLLLDLYILIPSLLSFTKLICILMCVII